MRADTKYKGSIKLAAIGDALGWMTEFEKNKMSLKKKFGTDYINSFHDWEKNVGGRFYGYVDKLNSGSYSDDTQLLLSVARSIKRDGFVDQEYFAKKELPEWLLYSRGAGRTIKNAARKIERKSANWNNNFFKFKVGKATVDYRESGANGAAMRVLPIALANFGEQDKIQEEIFGNSIITHGHPRAILGAMLYGYSIDTILRFSPENFNYTNFLTELGKDIHQKFNTDFLEKSRFKNWESEWNRNSKEPFRNLFKSIVNETQDYLRVVYKLINNNATDFEVLTKLGCYKNETKGSGTSTVIAGIYLTCKYFNEPLKGIEQAVNSIGTDTDSIAAFTGGLIGGLHGQSIIPTKWKSVQDIDYLDAISIRLLEISESRADFKNPGTVKKDKYKSISEIESDRLQNDEKVYLETLGLGTVKEIERQKTLTKGKYSLILDVQFEIGQFCRFSKLLSIEKEGKTDLFTESIENDVNLLNEINLDYDSKERIEKFMESLNDKERKEFKEIIMLIEKKAKR
ncbi:ADP-ribosylglycohydrolase family protein [Psychroflexus sp. YR1-1]|uniref:ADP-ribosylglycohydrolase family protein n=1 Tax=Psychroflexus aurantiacus TaxID=2709310 RepID=A0A6B3R9F2_9FLAO|nr:ADP-ribosylglycohydrolase family protein [Psychroflexus aurantiacus]NEV94194.1 ADP-ribosylglycohydrolase family protein [Psychroflexus aurantiacus]